MQTPSLGPTMVILNPAANRGNMAHHRAVVKHRLEASDAESVEYYETAKRGDALTLARMAAEQKRPVVIIGGDGSVNEAVNGVLIAGVQVPLGIVPAGSGNDFACQTLKLPKNPEEALEIALSGEPRAADAGMVNGRYFANSFSVGLDADITVAAEKMKRLPFMSGSLLYYSATLRQLFFGYGRCPWMTYSLDHDHSEAPAFQHFVLLAVTNGPTYGAGFRINPEADHTDGSFDICAVRYAQLPRALRLLPVVRAGKHAGQREVTFAHAKTVHIESREPVNGQMDGETMQASIYDARILPGALLVRH